MPLNHKQKRKLLQFFVPSIRDHPDWPVIISEGDSWFSFPLHKNTVDFLDDIARRKISLLRLEKNGDEALRIVGGKQKKKLRTYLKRYPVDALLFSGGGNEIVGDELIDLLFQKTSGMDWEDCIDKDAVRDRMAAIRGAYRTLIALRDEVLPDCRFYMHGYDYAIPDGRPVRMWGFKRGPWMKPSFDEKGISDPRDARRIIRWLIDRFNEMLAGLESDHAKVVLVRTRRTLQDSEWNDELHPSRAGFMKVARKFQARLKDQFPATFGS